MSDPSARGASGAGFLQFDTQSSGATARYEEHAVGGIHELAPNEHGVALDAAYYNADMAPTSRAQRRWGLRDIAALWISMAACIPTYGLASSLISEGMNWWQAVLTIALGNIIVLVPMVLNAHAGTKYGIPFPVYCRAAFGLRGANIPALLRALVACGWFGIQTWIGGAAIYTILGVWLPDIRRQSPIAFLDINLAQLACFFAFWLINVIVILRGIETIRFLLNIKAPLLIGLGLLLLYWAYNAAGGFGPILSQPSQFDAGGAKTGGFWAFFFPALTANVGFWATLSLNIPDFSRYAYSQRDQIVGQALGLPTTMALYAFIGVAVTSATVVIYGKAIWDPVELLSRFDNHVALVISMLAIMLATLATNIAANVVSPANDFAHLWPRRINFRTGGLITAVIGVLMMPWKLYADPSGYIFKWLIAYSGLLGAIGGVLIADYYVVRRTHLALAELYVRGGPYWYRGGFSGAALLALIAGIVPCAPGFLGTVAPKVFALLVTNEEFAALCMRLYDYAWFISFGVAFLVYVLVKAGAELRRE